MIKKKKKLDGFRFRVYWCIVGGGAIGYATGITYGGWWLCGIITGVPTADGIWPGAAATGWPIGAPYIPIPGGIFGWCGLCFMGAPTVAPVDGFEPPDWPVIGIWCEETSPLLTLVMSWMLVRRLSRFIELSRMKYFWAWLATCVGVLEIT